MSNMPYQLLVLWRDGRVEVVAEGHNPVQVMEAEVRVARNDNVIDRITLVDSSGPLRTIWARDWYL